MSSNDGEMCQFRVRSPNGQHMVEISSNETIGVLKMFIQSVTQLNPDDYRVMVGYPPERRFLCDNDQPLKEIFPNRREAITLEKKSRGDQASIPRAESISTTNIEATKLEGTRQMVREVVPPNNSCLFTSIHYCMVGQHSFMDKCPQMRELVVETVKADPETYNEAFLGKPNAEYCEWIRNQDHWGGGIEIDILAKRYSVEIVVVDIQYIQLIRFGEDQKFSSRIFIIFDGVHYDALVVENADGTRQTMFSTEDNELLEVAFQFAIMAHKQGSYTDLVNMAYQCDLCRTALSNQKEMIAHSRATGHNRYSEPKVNNYH